MSALRLFLMLIILAASDAAAARAQDHKAIQVIYLGAYNCVYCTQWEQFAEPAWRNSPAAAQVELRKIKFPFFQQTDIESSWPEDLRWVREQTKARGAPRFIVAVDHRVVATAFGINGWSQRIVPLLADLAAHQEAAAAQAHAVAEDSDLPRPTRD